MSWREVTIAVIIAAPLIIGGYDWIAYERAGNSATISRTLLDAARRWPIIGVAFGFGLGLLCGHLFVPQHLTAEKYPTVAKMVGPPEKSE